MKQLLTLFRYRKEVWAMLWVSLRHICYEDLTDEEKRILSPKAYNELREVSRGSQKHLEWWKTLSVETQISLCLFFLGYTVKADHIKDELSNDDIKYIYDTRQKVALGINLY